MTQHRLRVWQAADGLPNNHVQAILQTRDGFLWVGTEEGVARFDGTAFRVFDRGNTPAMRLNSVISLVEDAAGTLWVGTRGGVNRYRSGQWSEALTTADGLPSDRVICLLVGRDGSVWIGTEGGLARFKEGALAPVTTDAGPVTDAVTSLVEDAAGVLWATTEGRGLLRIEDGGLVRYTTRDGLPHDNVRWAAPDGTGGLWLATAKGLGRLQGGRLETPREGKGLRGFVHRVLRDRDGSLWMGTDGKGLARLCDGSLSSWTAGRGFAADVVETLYEDRHGTLWVGTNGGGLAALSDEAFTVHGSREGLASDRMRTVYEDRNGTMWIGTQRDLTGLRPDGRVTTVTAADGLPSTGVLTLAGGSDGSLWIGTRTGLGRLVAGRFRTYTTADGLGADDVRAIEEDRAGDVWIGTKGGGLTRWRAGRFTVYTTRDGLSSDHVTTVRQTRDGTLWVGTHAGLNRIRGGVFQAYGTEAGLPSDAIHAFAESEDGTLWIATAGGLARHRDGRFLSYSTTQGLHEDLILALLDDGRGSLWMGGNKGIFRVERVQIDRLDRGEIPALTPVVYGLSDGLRSMEVNGVFQNTAWRSRDGRLWFATYNGAAVVDPAAAPEGRAPPPVFVEAVRTDRRSVAPSTPDLAPGRGELEFDYTAVELRHPERVTFRYKLEGYDQEWIEAGTRRSAYYTNLPPGRYRFRVLASAVGGAWSGEGAAVSLRLRPHFHQTPWFYALCAAAVAGAGLGIHRLRVGELQRRERRLQARVQEAVARLRMLSGLLPICAWCKKIRDDHGYWNQIEGYIAAHSEADFSHGICPDCSRRVRSESPTPSPADAAGA